MFDWRGHLRALGAALIALPLVWWPVVSVANPYVLAWNVIKSASGGKVALPTASNLLRQFQLGGASLSGLAGGGVKAAGTVALPVGNTAIGGLVGSTVGRSALLTGAAKVASWTVPGAAIAAALEFVRCRRDGTSIAGIIDCDPLTDPQPFTGTHYRYSAAYPWVPTRAQACEQVAHYFNAPQSQVTCYAGGQQHSMTLVVTAVPHASNETACVASWQTYDAWCSVIPASNLQGIYKTTTTTTSCVPPSEPGGPDGKCTMPEENWIPEDDLGGRFLDWRNQPGWPSAATDLELAKDIAQYDGPNEPIPAPAVSTSIENQPGSVPGGSKVSTKVNADGTKTQTTTTTTYNVTYNGDTYYVTTTTSTTIQNFDENDDPLGPPVTETETDTPPVTDPGVPEETPEDLECGLPGYAPCKIDEQGTPPPEDPFEDPDEWFDPIRGVFDNPPTADTSWSWAFSLPSSCSVLTVGTFAGHTVTLDLCQWQPMIHSIVSMVWLIAGIWLGVGMVGRTLGGT